jgi:hypothetical protein
MVVHNDIPPSSQHTNNKIKRDYISALGKLTAWKFPVQSFKEKDFWEKVPVK